METPKYEIYFVDSDGQQDGEDGVYAITTDGIQQKPGWYFIPGNCANGIGPYPSRFKAEEAAEEYTYNE